MATNYYKLILTGFKGAVYVSYKKGILHVAVNELETGNGQLATGIPLDHRELEESGFIVQELKPKSVSSKAALFIMMFKEYRNVVYTPTKVELANLKHVTCNQELFKTYFEAKDYPLAGPKTITDYIRNYNAVRDLHANGKPVRSGFPDYYDSGYEKTLSPEKLSAYRLHLVQNGWRKVDGVWVQNTISTKQHED